MPALFHVLWKCKDGFKNDYDCNTSKSNHTPRYIAHTPHLSFSNLFWQNILNNHKGFPFSALSQRVPLIKRCCMSKYVQITEGNRNMFIVRLNILLELVMKYCHNNLISPVTKIVNKSYSMDVLHLVQFLVCFHNLHTPS